MIENVRLNLDDDIIFNLDEDDCWIGLDGDFIIENSHDRYWIRISLDDLKGIIKLHENRKEIKNNGITK